MNAVTPKLRVLIVDASPIASACVAAALNGSEEIECTSTDRIAAVSSDSLRPDVILIALGTVQEGRAGAKAGAEGLLRLTADVYPDSPALILSSGPSSSASDLVQRHGISGWLTEEHTVEQVTAALALVHAGLAVLPRSVLDELRGTARLSKQFFATPNKRTNRKPDFTGRQAEVVDLLMEGMSNKGIAYRLGITESAVKNHLHSIMIRTGVMSRTQLILTLLGSR